MKANTILAVLAVLAYAAISAFLCLAAIANPNLNDSEQYLWCAAAVAWGPILAVVLYVFGFVG